MEPVTFGKKRGLSVKPLIINTRNTHDFKKNRHGEIIDKLREFVSVRMWENENDNWTYETLQKLKQTPYLLRFVPEKRNKKGYITDCPDYFFLLTTIQNRRICCFIEKKKPLDKAAIYQTRFRFKDELFNGTLFTGTLTMSDEKRSVEREEITYFFSQIFKSIKREISAPLKLKNWLFVLNDIWASYGKDMSSMLAQRLVQIQDIIGKEWYPDAKLDVCDFDIITYNNYNTIEDFLRNQRKYFSYNISDHKVVAICTQGIPGIDEHYISLKSPIPKPLLSETISFKNGEWDVENVTNCTESLVDNVGKKEQYLFLKISDYPDVYWVYNPKTWKKLGAARVRTLGESKQLKELFNNIENTGRDYLKLPCKWIQEFEKWQPILK